MTFRKANNCTHTPPPHKTRDRVNAQMIPARNRNQFQVARMCERHLGASGSPAQVPADRHDDQHGHGDQGAAAFSVHLSVQSLRCVEGASCPNQSRDCVGGQSLLRNKSSKSLSSVNVSLSSRAASSRRNGFRHASRAPNGTPISSSQASANRALARFTRSIRLFSSDRSVA